jgi:hypothetical protein
MSMSGDVHGQNEIEETEELCRRIPASTGWYDPERDDTSPEAFQPRTDDTGGLSLYRRKFQSPEDLAAVGSSKAGYYVAIVKVADLQRAGIHIRQDDPNDCSHVVVPELRADNRKRDEALELMQKLAGLVSEVVGPFPSASSRR